MAGRRAGSKRTGNPAPAPEREPAPVYRVWRAPAPAQSNELAPVSSPGAAVPGRTADISGRRVFRAPAPADSHEHAAHAPGCRFYPDACVRDLWVCESGCRASSHAPVSRGHPNYAGNGSTDAGEYSLNVAELRADFERRTAAKNGGGRPS